MNDKMWERTDDVMGHRPKFRVWCQFCDSDMFIRFSYVFPEPDLMNGFVEPGNLIAFKCPKCGYHVRFNIIDDNEYIQKIHAARGSVGYYYPITELREVELIEKQLKALGYWGGREENGGD
jgi:hypothetical protein